MKVTENGIFKNGEFKEFTVIDRLANDMMQSASLHYDEYQQQNPNAGVVIWRQSRSGAIVIFTPNQKYADQLKKFIARMK